MIRHPELVGDLIEIRRRKARHRRRVADSNWGYTLKAERDVIALQVPIVKPD
jgi:hypothetical protein